MLTLMKFSILPNKVRNVLGKMEEEEENWSETSSFRDFVIKWEMFWKEKPAQRPIVRKPNVMNLKELDRLQSLRKSLLRE